MTATETAQQRLIAIEGLPGSGHSELAQWIGDQPGWYAETGDHQWSEQPNGKPPGLSQLLQKLLTRFERNHSFVGVDLFRENVITDYLFDTHLLWARALLKQFEWDLYQKIAAVMTPPAIVPDLVVYLQAPEEDIRESLRVMDKHTPYDLWQGLIESFNHYFFGYDKSPLLVIRTTSSAWLGSETAKLAFLNRIITTKGAKTYVQGEPDLWTGGQPTADSKSKR